MKADAADSDSDEFDDLDQDNVSPHAHKMHDTYNAANAAARAIAAATWSGGGPSSLQKSSPPSRRKLHAEASRAAAVELVETEDNEELRGLIDKEELWCA